MQYRHSEDKETLFAYLTIHDFFDTYILQDAVGLLQSILKAANNKKPWKKAYPFTVVFYLEQLGKLSNAAFYINDNHAQRKAAITSRQNRVEDPSPELLQTCRGRRLGDTFWSCFPRHLTLNMFYDPYLAIKKFCSYMPEKQWLTTFEDIQEYALVGSSITDVHPPYNLLSLQRHLARLIEACHLLEVRTNTTFNNQRETRNK